MTRGCLVVVLRVLENFDLIVATGTSPRVKKLLLKTYSRASDEALRAKLVFVRFVVFCFTARAGEKNCQTAWATFCLKTYSARSTGVSARSSGALNNAGTMQASLRSALHSCQN